jgi:hypothetical protein
MVKLLQYSSSSVQLLVAVLAVRRASDSLKNVTMLLNLNNDPDRKGNSGGNGGTTSGMTSPTFKDSNNNDDPPRKGNSGGPGGSASGRSSPLFTRVRNLTQGIWNPEFLQQLVEASACTVGAEVNLQL